MERISQGIFVVYEVKRDALPEVEGGGYPGGQWVGAVVVHPGVLGTWHIASATNEVYAGTSRLARARLVRLAERLFAIAHGKPYQRPPQFGAFKSSFAN